MKTRMQRVDTVWSKMPRLVRDLARTCGKRVRLTMEGRETEIDRAVLEAIKDPLTHLVRNAVDHGIERPQDRVAAGKAAEGVLTLRAYHDAGQVHLEVSDDGAGMDPAKIAAKAVERGLVPPARLAAMTRREILDLIFLPGFSTARHDHPRLGPRRRDGRGQDPDRGHRRRGRRPQHRREGLHLPAHHPADPRDSPSPHSRVVVDAMTTSESPGGSA